MSMITIRRMTMIGFAAKAIVKEMGAKNECNCRNQQLDLIGHKNFLYNEKNEAGRKNKQRQGAVMMTLVTME